MADRRRTFDLKPKQSHFTKIQEEGPRARSTRDHTFSKKGPEPGGPEGDEPRLAFQTRKSPKLMNGQDESRGQRDQILQKCSKRAVLPTPAHPGALYENARPGAPRGGTNFGLYLAKRETAGTMTGRGGGRGGAGDENRQKEVTDGRLRIPDPGGGKGRRRARRGLVRTLPTRKRTGTGRGQAVLVWEISGELKQRTTEKGDEEKGKPQTQTGLGDPTVNQGGGE